MQILDFNLYYKMTSVRRSSKIEFESKIRFITVCVIPAHLINTQAHIVAIRPSELTSTDSWCALSHTLTGKELYRHPDTNCNLYLRQLIFPDFHTSTYYLDIELTWEIHFGRIYFRIFIFCWIFEKKKTI